MILGVFFAFFFFACESTEHNPTDRDTTTKEKDDNDNTDRNRSRPRSSSRGSSGDGNTDGSSDGSTDGPTVIDDDCPEASEVDDHPHLTTITFYKSIVDEDEGGGCGGTFYTHPHFSWGYDSDEDYCNCNINSKGSTNPSQNTILKVGLGDNDELALYINEEVVGETSFSNRYYLYYQRDGESEYHKWRFMRTRGGNRWTACQCEGKPQLKITSLLAVFVPQGNGRRRVLNPWAFCSNNVVKVWLAKETSSTCEFF